VLWKTAIEGRGHSSPVLWEDHVYLTSAYESQRSEITQSALAWAETAVLALVAAGCGAWLARWCRMGGARRPSIGAWCSVWAFAVALIGAGVLILAGQNVLGYERSVVYAWFGTALAVVACLALAAWRLGPHAQWARATGLLAAALAVVIVIGVPDKARGWRGGLAGRNLWIWVTVALVPMAMGLRLWFVRPRALWWRPNRLGATGDRPAARLARLTLLLAFTGLCAVAVYLGLVHASPFLASHLGKLRLTPVLGIGSVAIVACSGTTALLGGLMLRRRAAAIRILGGRRLALGAIALLTGLHGARIAHLMIAPELRRAIVCLDRHTGQTLWVCEGLGGPLERLHPENSPATPTAAADADGVYAWFGSAGLMACDHDGRLRWTHTDFPYHSTYGVASSPVLHDGVLVVVSDRTTSPYVAGVDAATGRRLWTSQRPAVPADYRGGSGRSPLILALGGRDVVVVWGQGDLTGYDLHNGGVLWTYRIRSYGEVAPSAVSDSERLYLVDRELARAVCLDRLGEADLPVEWETRLRGPDCASPLLAGGLLLTASMDGTICCLDARDGRVLWTRRVGGAFYASPLLVGSRVLLLSAQGEASILLAGRRYEEIATWDMGQDIYASPAPADGRLYVRTVGHLLCLGGPRSTAGKSLTYLP
jgi:outer membrane protein assembly factor BamB